MPRKTGPCNIRPEDAAIILGIDAQTLRLCLQQGYYKDIGEAVKSSADSEAYTYDISKFKLYQRQGLDVNVPVDETIRLIKSGKPPFIKQVPLPVEQIMDLLTKEKDTPTVQSKDVSSIEPL